MKIKYLKTTEEFQIEVPDPLNESECIFVRISDYDLMSMICGRTPKNLDDDTKLGIQKLLEKYILTTRTMKLAKRQQHLRKLNRVESAWIELKSKERQPRQMTSENIQRINYLRENFDEISLNCVKHDWYEEFYQLCKDSGKIRTKKDIISEWKRLKNEYYGVDTY